MPRCICHSDSLRDLQFAAALSLSEGIFNVKTARANEYSPCLIKEAVTSKIIRDVGTREEVIEVTENEYLRIHHEYPGDIVGYYDPENARIFLISQKWCISHIIHETLHSRCVFCKRDLAYKGFMRVVEGLNELLTGVVLKGSLPDCYNFWRMKTNCFCRPYMNYLKTWYYLSTKISFRKIVDLFFDVKNQNPIQNLEIIIAQETGFTFQNIFVINRSFEGLFAHERFVNFLRKNYDDFSDFYKSPLIQIHLDHFRV